MRYSEPLLTQVQIVLVFLGVGFLLGMWYLFCSVFRKLFADSRVATFFLDFLFCAGAFFALFASFLAYTNGVWRLSALVSAGCGFFLFHMSIGRLMTSTVNSFCSRVRRLNSFLFRTIRRISNRLCTILHDTFIKRLMHSTKNGKQPRDTRKIKKSQKRKKYEKST